MNVFLRNGIVALSFCVMSFLMPLSAWAASIDIYVTESCGFCRQLESFFDQKGISYKRYDINQSSRAKRKFDSFGGRGVPLTVIDSDTIIRGFKPGKIMEAIKEQKGKSRRNII